MGHRTGQTSTIHVKAIVTEDPGSLSLSIPALCSFILTDELLPKAEEQQNKSVSNLCRKMHPSLVEVKVKTGSQRLAV